MHSYCFFRSNVTIFSGCSHANIAEHSDINGPGHWTNNQVQTKRNSKSCVVCNLLPTYKTTKAKITVQCSITLISCGTNRPAGNMLPIEDGWFQHSRVRVDQLLCDVIQEVPAAVSKGALQEGQGNQAHVVLLKTLKCMRRLQPVILPWEREKEREDTVRQCKAEIHDLLNREKYSVNRKKCFSKMSIFINIFPSLTNR